MQGQNQSQRVLRRSQRYPASFAAELVRSARTISAVIKDLSSGGALLEAETELRVGSRVSLEARRLKVDATVVRAAGNRFGVQFASPIDALEVIRQNVVGLEHLRRPHLSHGAGGVVGT